MSSVPAGHRLVTCTECGARVLVEDGHNGDQCGCGAFLPAY